MPERIPSSSSPESKPSKKADDEWHPSDEELADFEREREGWSGTPKYIPTFEDYFGRPDPRIIVYERPADLPEDAWYPSDDEIAAFEREQETWQKAFNEPTTFYDYFGRPDPRVKRILRPDEFPSQPPEADEAPGAPRT